MKKVKRRYVLLIPAISETNFSIVYVFSTTDILDMVEFKVHNNSDEKVRIELIGFYELIK